MSFRTVPELLQAAVAKYGDAPAIITDKPSESFQSLGESVSAAARELERRGVAAGERMLIAARNSLQLIHVWLGAICAGAIPAAVNPESTRSELEYFTTDLQPRLTLLEDDVLQFMPPVTPGPHSQQPPPPLAGEGAGGGGMDVAAIVYTSGTTSRPKGVMVRHAAYTESGESFPGWIGLGKKERLWACLPMFHINAQAYSLMSTLAHGYPLALSEKFHATTFWQDAKRLEVTSVNVVGAMLEFVARQPESAWVESSLRTIYAAPAPRPEQRRELEQRFKVRIVTGYGMSENPFGCAETSSSRDKAGSVGRPRQPASGAFQNRLRILKPDQQDAAEAEVGELCFQNPVMTPGYWNAPEISTTVLVDGWLHTGDAGYRDRDGDVFLTGRYKEMIRRRGENVAPAEVEAVLAEHESVEAVAVFGVDAGLEEEEVVAAVVLRDGQQLDAAILQAFARTRLAAFKVPSRIVFRESLPMTPTQRIAKDILRKEYGRGR